MEEAEVNSEQVEVAPHEANDTTPQEEPQTQQNQAYDDKQERNWRAARERMSELERQNREKDELLKQALSFQKAQQPIVQDEPEEPDEDFVPKGKVKKIANKAIEPLQQQIQELRQELQVRKQQELIQSLKSVYPDFDDIINPETLALFEEKKPKLAKTIAENTDPYKMAVQSYEYIKALNLVDELPNRRRKKDAEKIIDKNSKTVQSPQAFDKRPMAQAFRFQEGDKALYAEMMGFASGASAAPPM